MKFLFSLLNSADFTVITGEISELLKNDAMRLLRLMSNTIYSYIRHDNDFILGVSSHNDLNEEKKDLADQVPHIRTEAVSHDIDDFVVKGEGSLKKLRIIKDKIKQKNYYEEFLTVERNISQFSSKIVKSVDERDDYELSFSVYDGFKQLADNNLGHLDSIELAFYEPEALF